MPSHANLAATDLTANSLKSSTSKASLEASLNVPEGLTDQMLLQMQSWIEHYGFNDYKARRLSYDQLNPPVLKGTSRNDQVAIENISKFEGISQANHHQMGEVIVKWELIAIDRYLSHGRPNPRPSQQGLSQTGLAHECAILKALAESATGISSALLKHYQQPVRFANRLWQMTIAVLPYYPLGSLKTYLVGSVLSPKQKHTLLKAAANAIVGLHQAGWGHGDIKPSNFLLANDSFLSQGKIDYSVLLSDFSLAGPAESRTVIDNIRGSELIAPKGTPAYLAPECWQGHGISQQSDSYAFGVMLFEILMGYKPYQINPQPHDSQNAFAEKWAFQHCQSPLPKLPNPWQRYQYLLEGLLAKHPNNRIDSAQVMIELNRLGTVNPI
ncbi:MAG: protein kinase [Psychrobacter sp.]|nr:protein kinase [Psychrobacter sp.]